MALKTYNPTTPSQRQLVNIDRSSLYKGGPVKALTEGQISTGGRNNNGRITSRFRGGGHKQAYRKVDFRRAKLDVPATVERLEYDPNRTAFIALIKYQDGELAYILAPQRLAPGDTVIASERADVKPGNAMPIASIPVGTIVHNVEIKIGKGGQIARSAGSYVQIVGRDQDYVILRLSTTEQRLVHGRCMATVGAVSNPDNMNTTIGKGPPALEGLYAAQPRHRHEPGRSSARRPHQGRQALGNALGQADQGRQDAQEQAHHQIHSGQPSRPEEKAAAVGTRHHDAFCMERSLRRRLSAEKGRSRAHVWPPRHDQDMEPALDHSAAVRRPEFRRL